MALARITRIDTSSRVAAPQTKFPKSRVIGNCASNRASLIPIAHYALTASVA